MSGIGICLNDLRNFKDHVLFVSTYSFVDCGAFCRIFSKKIFLEKRVKSMAKFMLVYRDPVPTNPPSPEEMQGFLALWGEWFQQCGASIVDGGDALAPTDVVAGGRSRWPYIEGKKYSSDTVLCKPRATKRLWKLQSFALSPKLACKSKSESLLVTT